VSTTSRVKHIALYNTRRIGGHWLCGDGCAIRLNSEICPQRLGRRCGEAAHIELGPCPSCVGVCQGGVVSGSVRESGRKVFLISPSSAWTRAQICSASYKFQAKGLGTNGRYFSDFFRFIC
jgi:hypothetical protein